MDKTDISNIRLHNQQIASTQFKEAKDLVGWMGAIQAQDFQMSKWAVGSRIKGATDSTIQKALDDGDILRTHLMRPTWHLVSADDIYWMLELTSPQIKAQVKHRDTQLGLDDMFFNKTNNLLEKALAGNKHLTRQEIMDYLEKHGIKSDASIAIHIMYRAEADSIVCSGKMKNNKQTYGLLSERVQKRKSFDRDKALEMLAHKYFLSHSPATLKDFVWWSGLSVTDSRKALEMIKKDFVTEKIGEETYIIPNNLALSKFEKNNSVYLLPAFDELLISYKDRTAFISKQEQGKVFTNNGIFRPFIVSKVQVIGLWKKEIKSKRPSIKISLFEKQDKNTLELIDIEIEKLLHYLNS